MHRIIAEDGGWHCFACGIHSEDHAAMDAVPCHPGGWMHPPYIVGFVTGEVDGGKVYVETCAAHPYAGCGNDAYAVTVGGGVPDGR